MDNRRVKDGRRQKPNRSISTSSVRPYRSAAYAPQLRNAPETWPYDEPSGCKPNKPNILPFCHKRATTTDSRRYPPARSISVSNRSTKTGPEMDVKFYVEKCYDKPLEWLSGDWSGRNEGSSDAERFFAKLPYLPNKHKIATQRGHFRLLSTLKPLHQTPMRPDLPAAKIRFSRPAASRVRPVDGSSDGCGLRGQRFCGAPAAFM